MRAYAYGLGVVITGDWVMQAPLFSGEAGAFAYLPSKKVAIAVAVTMSRGRVPAERRLQAGGRRKRGRRVWREIATALVPSDAPPPRKS